MPVAAQGTTWNLLNYWGDLFTAAMIETPFLSMIGGLTGGGKETANFEFPTSVEFDFRAAAQPAITENQSLTAPTPNLMDRTQKKNVTQIYQESVKLSYEKLSNYARLSGINTAGASNPIKDELDAQIKYNLQTIARDIEYTILNGVYQIATDADTANKTRGMLALCDIAGGTAIDAGASYVDRDLMQTFFRTMFAAGAKFENLVLWTNAWQKQAITDIYAYAPDDRNVGGVNIKVIETDFGNIGVAGAHKFMPTTEVLCSEMSEVAPVTQPVPTKGNMFYEPLAKVGGSEDGQLYGKFGLAHGPAFMHGKITNLLDA